MRLASLRFRVRQLMIVVAIAAALVTAGKVAWRSARYWKLASHHQKLASVYGVLDRRAAMPPTLVIPKPPAPINLSIDPRSILAEEWTGNPKGRPPILSRIDPEEIEREVRRAAAMLEQAKATLERDRRELRKIERMGAYHARLSREYRRAALRPWLPSVSEGTLPK